MNRESFAPLEWYHCFTRGVDKRKTFIDEADYRRFHELLYLCNSSDKVHRSNLKKGVSVFEIDRPAPLVNIGVYCLMPNHFHILLQEIDGGGISAFMRKLGTAYAMYFNKRYERVGNLFVKPFRSRHVFDDAYAKQVSAYIHLNPLDIYHPDWINNIHTFDKKAAEAFLTQYNYSSFWDYQGISDRIEEGIISSSAKNFYESYGNNTFETLLKHAQDFIKVSP